MAKVTNLFDSDWIAHRYAAGRPDVHRKIADYLGFVLASDPLATVGIDFACGTGLSAIAVTALARRVVATDASLAMIRAADHHPAVRYAVASAESLPFHATTFDVATLGCAYRWCDPDLLFAEVARILRPGAPFIIYDSGFYGEMRESESAKEWYVSTYNPKFPPPLRRPAFRAEVTPAAFEHERTDFIEEWIPFTHSDLVRYLTTQTNIISAVQSGRESIQGVEAYLERELEPFFQSCARGVGHFRFGGLRLPPVSLSSVCGTAQSGKIGEPRPNLL